MTKTRLILAALAGLAFAGAAAAQDAPAPAKAKEPYDVHKDPCGPVILKYCSDALAKMDHPTIHACLITHDDELTNACRSNMGPPRPPLRPEVGAAPQSKPAG